VVFRQDATQLQGVQLLQALLPGNIISGWLVIPYPPHFTRLRVTYLLAVYVAFAGRSTGITVENYLLTVSCGSSNLSSGLSRSMCFSHYKSNSSYDLRQLHSL